jgi:hypothetical protein
MRLPGVHPPVVAAADPMVRFPRSWKAAFHPQARRGPSGLAYRPGWRGSGMQPITPTPITRYTGRISSIPLTGGQALAIVPASGAITLSVGPQGLGTVWYPVQVTLSTTTGALDTSTAQVYLGSGNVPNTLVGQVFSGNGTVALAIPDMTPGQSLVVQWAGAHPGDTAAFNIIGTMDALSTG